MNRTSFCDEHNELIKDSAKTAVSVEHLEAAVARIEANLNKLERRVYLLSGGIGVASALAVMALKPLFTMLMPSAQADEGEVALGGVIDPIQVDRLVESWSSGQWGLFVGILLIGAVFFAFCNTIGLNNPSGGHRGKILKK